MYGNKNWEMSKKRYEAWWANDVLDRPVIKITAPRDGVQRRCFFVESPVREKWHDVDYIVEAQKDAINSTYYGGDAFAWFFPNLGTDWFCGILGADVRYTEYRPGHPPFEYTAWAKPFVEDWETHTFAFDADNPTYQRGVELVRSALEASNGEYAVGFPDLIGGIDCMANIRGTENFCLDLMDYPESVIANKMAQVWDAFKETYNRLFEVIRSKQDFAPATLPVWHNGKYFCHINDFSYMVSPELFRKFVLPDVNAELDFWDASIYHLDGLGSLRHLNFLLESPKLKAIQWVPGDGQPGMEEWIPLLKKMQAAGKSLYVNCTPGNAMALLDALSPKGLLLEFHCKSQADAMDILAMMQTN